MAACEKDVKDHIRQATFQDIEALVDIYIECFPERVKEVFGGPQRRVFIHDYLRYSLALDSAHNWVYVRAGSVVGFVMAPCEYSPWRAMFSQGLLFRCAGHFLTGKYGFPLHIMKGFLKGGFTFDSDPAIKRLRGKPYIHLDAVKPVNQRESSKGLLGIGRQLMQWAIAAQRKNGANFCWGIVQPTASRYLPIWKRVGFRVYPISNGRWLIQHGESDEGIHHSESH